MNKPLNLDPSGIVEFITRPEPTVLFLSVEPVHRFNPYLCEHLVDAEGTEVAFGQLPLLDLFESDSPSLLFLLGQIQAFGESLPLSIPPGYYFFRHGRMLAWDFGLPATADAKRIIQGSMLGAALSLLTRNMLFVRRAFRSATEAAAATRVAYRFRCAAAGDHYESRRTEAPADELDDAYRDLGVDPTASDEEVTRAWRTLQQKFHPDRAANDPVEFDRLSRRCVEINRARQIIRKHRRRSRRYSETS